MISNIWDQDDSDEEQDQQENQNVKGGSNTIFPARGVDNEFCRAVQTIKWKIYNEVILSPPLKTEEAQDNGLIKAYLFQLNQLYLFFEKVTMNQMREMILGAFKISMRHEILSCAKQMIEYGKANHFRPVDWIPYRDYLNIVLRVHPFVHHKRMIGGQEDNVEDM